LLMRMPTRDNSGGFRGYRVAQLRRTDLGRLLSQGYSFQEEILFRCHLAGARIGETPIIFEDRRAGATKVNPREMIRSLALLFWLGLLAIFGYTRRGAQSGQTSWSAVPSSTGQSQRRHILSSFDRPRVDTGVKKKAWFPAPEGWPRRLAS